MYHQRVAQTLLDELPLKDFLLNRPCTAHERETIDRSSPMLLTSLSIYQHTSRGDKCTPSFFARRDGFEPSAADRVRISYKLAQFSSSHAHESIHHSLKINTAS